MKKQSKFNHEHAYNFTTSAGDRGNKCDICGKRAQFWNFGPNQILSFEEREEIIASFEKFRKDFVA